MGFFTSAITGIGKVAFGGGIRRIGTGAVVGGIIGGATTDARTGTGKVEAIARGALWGAGVGALTTRTVAGGLLRIPYTLKTYGMARRAGGGIFESARIARIPTQANRQVNNLNTILGLPHQSMVGTHIRDLTDSALKFGWGAGKTAMKTAGRVGGWALLNPGKALAVGAGGLGLYSLAGSSPGTSSLTINQRAQAMQMMGGPSTGFAMGMGSDSRQEFEASAEGLTLGLHARRHQ